MPNVANLRYLFLIGALCSRVTLDYRRKTIQVNFADTKKDIAVQLHEMFGGSLFTPKTTKGLERVYLSITSRSDMERMLRVVKHFKDAIPPETYSRLTGFIELRLSQARNKPSRLPLSGRCPSRKEKLPPESPLPPSDNQSACASETCFPLPTESGS